MRLQVLTAASMKMTPFWDIALCSLVEKTDVSEVSTASIIRMMTIVSLRTFEMESTTSILFRGITLWGKGLFIFTI
jgi:hypothetical protein